MKCKYCKEEINLTIFGMPEDTCWGCLVEKKKEKIVDKNVVEKKKTKIL